ncbi:ATP synthase subunit I [Mycoplasmatota bacterium]|nr:ATP synthase subunit I [Mycoplasmatota bacterium]
MSDNQDFNTTYQKIIGISWVIMISVIIILSLVSIIFLSEQPWYSLPISYLLGAMTNIFAFNLLKNNIANITADSKNAIAGSFTNYAVRLMIYAFVLFISFNNDKLNPYVVASGFITVRIAIYIYSLLNKNK